MSELAVSDWDAQDGAPQIFLLSSDEHQVGVTKLDEHGRIAFPTIIPLGRKAFDHVRRPVATRCSQTDAGGDRGAGHQPFAGHVPSGCRKHALTQTLAADFKAMPSSMSMHDSPIRDGLADLIVLLIPYEKNQRDSDPEAGQYSISRRRGRPAARRQQRAAVVERFGRSMATAKEELLLAQREFCAGGGVKAGDRAGTPPTANRSGIFT